MTTERTPGALGSHEQLGPLPPHRKVTAHGRMWTEEDMRAYRAAGVAAERERWADAMRAVMCSPVGMQARDKLAAGQGTNTPGGRAWLTALRMLDLGPNTATQPEQWEA